MINEQKHHFAFFKFLVMANSIPKMINDYGGVNQSNHPGTTSALVQASQSILLTFFLPATFAISFELGTGSYCQLINK